MFHQPTHLINVDIVDNREQAAVGGQLILKLVKMVSIFLISVGSLSRYFSRHGQDLGRISIDNKESDFVHDGCN